MKKVRVFMFSLHRIIGTIISLFFSMWFITGLVLIYHSFPNVSKSQIHENMDILSDSLTDINSVLTQLPEASKNNNTFSLRYFQEQSLFEAKTKDSIYTICDDSLQAIKPITWETIQTVAKKWVSAPIAKVDTLNKRDIWIMYSRYTREMPIYKFYFDDNDKHQLYIASRTGEVLQFTNKDQRFLAWVGSIPHKLYIPALRRNDATWILTLTIAGFLSMFAAISGIYLGLFLLRKNYKAKKKIASPYKKSWYKWHHITGLVFGVFMITFAFSGAMALQRIPQWVIKTHGSYAVTNSQLRGKPLSTDGYKLDYRTLKVNYPDLKSVEWSYFQDIPIYNLVVGNREICIDASSTEIKKLYLSQLQIEKAVTQLHGKDTAITISMIDRYEEYYLSRKNNLPLPVYKVTVANADQSWYYIDPTTGDFKYSNKSRRAKKWVFSGLHYLNVKWLIERPVLWAILIWTVCVGGLVVSLSGVWLSVRYMRRKLKGKKKSTLNCNTIE